MKNKRNELGKAQYRKFRNKQRLQEKNARKNQLVKLTQE